MTENKGGKDIVRKFEALQTRQILAIAITLFLVLLSAVLYKRSDLFEEISKNTLFGAQAVSIVAFIGFTAVNWRCPSCKKYLGKNIHRRFCGHCGVRLK